MVYDSVEPIGDMRADLRSGIVASAVANNGMREYKEAVKPSDFMLFRDVWDVPKQPAILDTDPEAQSALIMAAMFGIAPGE